MPFDPLAVANPVTPGLPSNNLVQRVAAPTENAFSQALSNAAVNPASTKIQDAASLPAQRIADASMPVRELHRSSLPPGSDNTLGSQVLNRLEALHRGDQKLHTPSQRTDAEQSSIAVVGLQPGPAAAPLDASQVQDKRLAGASGDEFAVMLQNFQQVYQQAIQVGLMTKSTGAFTSSMNKLMSST